MESDRYKQTGDLQYKQTIDGLISINGGPYAWNSTSEHTTRQTYYMHQGQNTPGYRQKLLRGDLLPYTYWRQYDIQGHVKIGTYSFNGSDSWGNTWNLIPSSPTCDHTDGEWIMTPFKVQLLLNDAGLPSGDQLVQASAAKMYSSGWDSLTFLAELHKAKSLYRNFLYKLFRYESPSQLAKLWLEGRYGWRILMYDLIDIHNVIAGAMADRTRFQQRSGDSGTYSITEEFSKSLAGTAHFISIYDVKWSMRGNLIADISPPRASFNPLVTAWELITFSFVIDWVLRIGQLFSSLSFQALVRRYSAAVGLYAEVTKRTYLAHYEPSAAYVGSSMTYAAETVAKMTARTPTSVSMQPFLSNRLNALKVVDLMALLAGWLKRR